MILPILSYGHSMLRKKCEEIDEAYPELAVLIANMWETLYGANGCGLAAPQINQPIRLFLVDSKITFNNLEEPDRKKYFGPDDEGVVETFINAKILNRSAKDWTVEEGCLSIPHLSGDVKRPWEIEIEYLDRHLNKQVRKFAGTTARMIQHEYDHIEGILYLEYLNLLKRKLIKGKLEKISKGKLPASYPMKFLK